MVRSSQNGYNQHGSNLDSVKMFPAGLVGHSVSETRSVAWIHNESNKTAFVYDQAGDGYALYADGKSDQLFDFSGVHSYADRRLWEQLEKELIELRETGAVTVNILDAGCGPGTWLRRLVVRAHELGFTTINARGFDIAREQIRRARFLSKDLETLPGVHIKFESGDLTQVLPEQDSSIDITLCLYSVLCHLSVAHLTKVVAEFARVTKGVVVTTVRPTRSLPTVFVDTVDKAVFFQNHPGSDRLDVALNDGRHFTLDVHLFGAKEITALFSGDFIVTELVGLDLFHSRFALDPRWTSEKAEKETMFLEHIGRLEDLFSADPDFLEYATHLLLVGKKRPVSRRVV